MPVPSKSPRGLPRCLGCWLTVSALASASVISDGTRGSVVSHVGADYGLTGGTKVGGNLFHSFSDFNLVSGESATFSGPGDVTHILARVTGASASSIDGTIRSTIPGANLFLMNPKGFVFGPNAKLDVTGSFAVTTADYLKLSDGGRFNAQAGAQDSLTAAPVSAFGFLSGTPASVSFNGSQLNVTEGKSFSVVAGDITLDGARVTGAGSRINLLSVKSSGEARFASPDPLSAIDTAQFSQMGIIALNGSAKIDTSGPVGGRVLIRGGKLVMDTGHINSDTTGSSPGEPIDIAMRESVTITDSTRAPYVAGFTSGVSTHADGSAAAGDVLINAPLITLSLGGNIDSQSRGTATASASGGHIVLRCDQLNIFDEFSIVDVDTSGLGAGGQIDVAAKQIHIEGTGDFTGLIAETGNISTLIPTGRGGDIFVNADSIYLANGGQFATTILGSGNAGDIHVNATSIVIDNGGFIASQADHFSTGRAGSIFVHAQQSVQIKGEISTFTLTTGAGGDIDVVAEIINVDGGLITAETRPSPYGAPDGGHGGSITLHGGMLRIANTGRISAETYGSGKGGEVNVRASSIFIEGPMQFTGISTSSNGSATGDAGNVDVVASGALTILGGGGQISANASFVGKGGNVSVHAASILIDQGVPSLVFTGIRAQSKLGAVGDAGSVDVQSDTDLTIRGGGEITASTFSPGAGGSVHINAKNLALDDQGLGALTGIFANSFSSGPAGDIGIVVSEGLTIKSGAKIMANASAEGKGGSISLSAGNITIDGKGELTGDPTGISASSLEGATGNGGSVFVASANELIIRSGGEISAKTSSSGNGGNVSVKASQITLFDGGLVDASTTGPGRGGVIDVVAESILIDGRTSKFSTGIVAETRGIFGGAGGDVTVNTGSLQLLGGGTISAGTQGTGAGGSVSVTANRIEAHGAGSGLRADTTGGDFGALSPSVGHVTLTIDIEHTYDSDLIAYLDDPSGGQSLLFAGVGGSGQNFTHTILSDSATQLIGDGSAPFVGTFRPSEPLTTFHGRSANGDWFLSLKDLAPQDTGTLLGWSLDFGGGQVFRFTGTPLAIPDAGTAAGDSFSRAPIRVQLPLLSVTPGHGGDVHVNAREIVITDGARISAETTNQAAGGDVQVRAGSVQITAGASSQPTLISAESTSTGHGGRGGDVLIDAGSLRISGRKGMDTGVSAKSNGFGSSGSITLNLGTLAMDSYATVGSSNTGTGTAGSVSIRTHHGLDLSHHSLITTSAAQGDAGNIAITSDASIYLNSHSSITASAGSNGGSIRIIAKDTFFLTDSSITATAGSVRLASGAGSGTGGNIFIDPKFIILDHSLISANAATGQGGNILLIADNFLPSESLITATGSTVGTVQITAPPLDLANALASLQGAFVDVSTSLQERCAMQLGKEFSSFLVVGRGSVEDSPDEPQEELTARVRQRGKGRVRLR